MKKRILILTLVLFVIFAIPAGASLPLVVDEADLLTSEEEAALEAYLQEKSDWIVADLVVLTVPALEGHSAQAYADDFYDYNGYGRCGSDADGALFLVAMEERQWAFSTSGRIMDLMTEGALDELEATVIPSLSSGDYDTAFRDYADTIAWYWENPPMDSIYAPEYTFGSEWIFISLIAGFLLALIPMGVLKSQLHTVRLQTGASSYQQSRVHITGSRDLFLYRNVSKKAIPKDPPRSSGGGVHVSSSGRSHGGRSGGF